MARRTINRELHTKDVSLSKPYSVINSSGNLKIPESLIQCELINPLDDEKLDVCDKVEIEDSDNVEHSSLSEIISIDNQEVATDSYDLKEKQNETNAGDDESPDQTIVDDDNKGELQIEELDLEEEQNKKPSTKKKGRPKSNK